MDEIRLSPSFEILFLFAYLFVCKRKENWLGRTDTNLESHVSRKQDARDGARFLPSSRVGI